jgi:hypothetical protein
LSRIGLPYSILGRILFVPIFGIWLNRYTTPAESSLRGDQKISVLRLLSLSNPKYCSLLLLPYLWSVVKGHLSSHGVFCAFKRAIELYHSQLWLRYLCVKFQFSFFGPVLLGKRFFYRLTYGFSLRLL